MAIHLFNSLTKRREEFIPLIGNAVNMYCCGVTVYDRCHLGHARSLYVFDVIRRYLKHRGYAVRFIRNITDIDDKIINRANKLGIGWEKIVEENIRAYHEDLDALGIDRANGEPCATQNIGHMKVHIEHLIQKGHAYQAGGNVYFSVRTFPSYGKLSGQSIEKMQEAVRIERDENKKDPLDFALWKKSKEGEPAWDSPWGQGRPGWHIECSAMSMNYLECPTLDIHAGGQDLIFPHHENEIAQSEALTGKPFAKYWIHHGLLTNNGQKMSKSLDNFITVEHALKKYSVDALKIFFLSSHYASSLDFNDAKMIAMEKNLKRFEIFHLESTFSSETSITSLAALPENLQAYYDEFLKAMDDDFNTPRALAILFELVNQTYKLRAEKKFLNIAYQVNVFLSRLAREIFGLSFLFSQNDLTPQEARILAQRQEARLKKDFNKSDELRELLKTRGIIVEDSKKGQSWRRA